MLYIVDGDATYAMLTPSCRHALRYVYDAFAAAPFISPPLMMPCRRLLICHVDAA